MEKTVLLLENYGEESAMLHQSFVQAGFQGPVIVVEDDGFLPENVISAYQFFCGGFEGKPRYFNQIQVPDYWEVTGTNNGGKVKDQEKERGRIFYAEPKHKRLVRVVDWLDENGVARVSDHYNRYGALYAKTFFNKEGKRFCKTYYDAAGKEIIVENFVTQDIILNRDGKVYIYRNKTQLVLKLLEELGAMNYRIFFNSLSVPFFVSEQMPAAGKEDVLFWQEGVRNDIPGNMRMILDGKAKRTQKIYVQKKDSFVKLLELGASKEILQSVGFSYKFERENKGSKEILICTNSERIEKCEELIQTLPEMHFHISAITEMSSKLMELGKYQNVSLYPGVKSKLLEELFDKCDYYLDINHEGEIVSAVKNAFMHNQLILGFSQTLHRREYVAEEHVFHSYEKMAKLLKHIMNDEMEMKHHLALQREAAMTEETAVYKALFT